MRARRRRVEKTAVEMTSYGNHKTVSTGLGNLAQNARFPHSHEPFTFSDQKEEEEEEEERKTMRPFVTSTGRWPSRSLGHIADRQE